MTDPRFWPDLAALALKRRAIVTSVATILMRNSNNQSK